MKWHVHTIAGFSCVSVWCNIDGTMFAFFTRRLEAATAHSSLRAFKRNYYALLCFAGSLLCFLEGDQSVVWEKVPGFKFIFN